MGMMRNEETKALVFLSLLSISMICSCAYLFFSENSTAATSKMKYTDFLETLKDASGKVTESSNASITRDNKNVTCNHL